MFGILVQPLEQYDGAIGVFFLANSEQYETLDDQNRSEFYRSIDLADSRVKVVLSIAGNRQLLVRPRESSEHRSALAGLVILLYELGGPRRCWREREGKPVGTD